MSALRADPVPGSVVFLDRLTSSWMRAARQARGLTVVSMLHYFFDNYWLGETHIHIHADNCSGQNKNSTMIWYLMWRVMTGRHISF